MGIFDWFRSRANEGPDACDPRGPIAVVLRTADGQIAEGLRKLGRPVEPLSHGAADLCDRLAAMHPAAVVISAESDSTNGFLTVKAVRGDGRLRFVPTIVFSTQATEETFAQHRKLRTAADGYVLGNDVEKISRELASVLGLSLPA